MSHLIRKRIIFLEEVFSYVLAGAQLELSLLEMCFVFGFLRFVAVVLINCRSSHKLKKTSLT